LKVFSFLPRSVKECLWTITDSWRGKLGLLIRYVTAKTSAKSCGEGVYIGPYVKIRNGPVYEVVRVLPAGVLNFSRRTVLL
jgi:hypothetical protein